MHKSCRHKKQQRIFNIKKKKLFEYFTQSSGASVHWSIHTQKWCTVLVLMKHSYTKLVYCTVLMKHSYTKLVYCPATDEAFIPKTGVLYCTVLMPTIFQALNKWMYCPGTDEAFIHKTGVLYCTVLMKHSYTKLVYCPATDEAFIHKTGVLYCTVLYCTVLMPTIF